MQIVQVVLRRWDFMIKRIIFFCVLLILFVGLVGRAMLAYQGLSVTSWWRSPWHNAEVGGNWLSLHLIGWAYDVVPVNSLLQQVIQVWPFKYVVESDHIHLQIL